jgi:hydrogenase maturation protease
MDAPDAPIAVLGLGNVLMGDDALGPYVIETLRAEYAFPRRVSVQDLGTPGLDLAPFILDREAVILVDSVSAEGRPGELRCWRRDALLRMKPGPRLTPHDPALAESLLLAETLGRGPKDVLLIGVVPESVATRAGLSHSVRAAVPQVVAEVLAELKRLGAMPTPCPAPAPPRIWWEKPPCP